MLSILYSSNFPQYNQQKRSNLVDGTSIKLLNMGYFSNPDSEKYLNSEEGINEIATKLSEAILASI